MKPIKFDYDLINQAWDTLAEPTATAKDQA